MKNNGVNIFEKMLDGGPNAPINILAIIIMVTFPSKIAVKADLNPVLMEPSKDLPRYNSSLIRSVVITFASTPIPTARIIPARPGSVNVKLGNTEKNPETAANEPATCPSSQIAATTPGSR